MSKQSRRSPRALRRGIGYIRVSRVNGRDGDSFISPEIQRDAILALAKLNGVNIVGWYVDLDQSGKKEDRPEFQCALDAIDAGEASVMVVWKMSRFARSVLVAEKALRRIEGPDKKHPRGQLIAGDLNIDTTTPTGRMMRGLLSLIAEWEREIAEEGWIEAKERAVARGLLMTRRAPLGYRFNNCIEGELVDTALAARALVPDPDTCELAVQVFVRRAAGASWSELVAYLREHGIRMSRQGISKMIANRAYLGHVVHGTIAVNEDAHEALVSPEQWQAAQSQHVAAPRPARNGNGGSLLAGILVCGSCGGRMTASNNGKGKVQYRCAQSGHEAFICPRPLRVLAERADPVVEERFLTWAKGRAEVEGTPDASALDTALVAKEQVEAELVATIESQSAARRPHLFNAKIARLEDDLDAAEARVAELRAAGVGETRRTDAVALWPELSTPERKKLIAAAVEEGHGKVVLHAPESSGRAVPFAERSEVAFG
ncbi:MAG TPA: recombinase family protein [Solirubrobacteraceae bacterium]